MDYEYDFLSQIGGKGKKSKRKTTTKRKKSTKRKTKKPLRKTKSSKSKKKGGKKSKSTTKNVLNSIKKGIVSGIKGQISDKDSISRNLVSSSATAIANKINKNIPDMTDKVVTDAIADVSKVYPGKINTLSNSDISSLEKIAASHIKRHIINYSNKVIFE